MARTQPRDDLVIAGKKLISAIPRGSEAQGQRPAAKQLQPKKVQYTYAQDHAPSSQPSDKGYDQTAHKKLLKRHHNASLSDRSTGQWVPLWVNAIELNFQIGGSEAQSRMAKSFFPRNFVQNGYAIQCQAPNLFIYGETIEFIHRLQHLAVKKNHLTRFSIGSRGYGKEKGGRILPSGPASDPKYAIDASGVVSSIDRVATVGDIAPTFVITLIVLKSEKGLWQTTDYNGRRLRSWVDQLASIKKSGGFVSDPDAPKLGPPTPLLPSTEFPGF